MDAFEQAHDELGRLEEIIGRHEDHIFTLRGWMLTVMGGLLAAFYTGNINLDLLVVQIALPAIALLFLSIEVRHSNLVEAVAERAEAVEDQIRLAHSSAAMERSTWYDGPRVSESCRVGAERIWPRIEMTFILNRPFYLVVILISAIVAIGLPPKTRDVRGAESPLSVTGARSIASQPLQSARLLTVS